MNDSPRFSVLKFRRPFLVLLLASVAVRAGLAQSESFLPESGYSEAVENGLLSAQETVAPEGWQGPWNLPKGSPSAGFSYRDTANLSPSPGGGVLITPTDEAAQEIGRKLASAMPMRGHKAIYASFRLNLSANKPQGMAYVLFSGVGGLGAGVNEGNLMVLVRRDVDATQEGKGIKGWVPLILQGYEPNTTYSFVVKISAGEDEWAADDEMEIWINPKEGATEEAGSSQAIVHNTDSPGNIAPPSGAITQVGLRVENLQGVTVKFDDLRVGTSWEGVTGRVDP